MSHSFRPAPLLLTALLALATGVPTLAEDAPPPPRPLEAAPEGLTENAGAYLAARVAETERDFTAAAEWYSLALASEPGDPALLSGLVTAQLALGRITDAANPARLLAEGGAVPSGAAALVLVADLARNQDYAELLDSFGRGLTVGDALDDLVAGWAELGQGRMSEALERFDRVVAAPGFEGIGAYQKALALAYAGDLEGADRLLAGPAGAAIADFRRGVLAHVQILSALERNAEALARFDQGFGGALDPELAAIRRSLEAGAPLPPSLVTSPREGIAETFYTFASAFEGQGEDELTLAFARVAQHLNPEPAETKLLVARLLLNLGQPRLAAEAYALIGPEAPGYVSAEIGRADALRAAGDVEGGIAVLTALAQAQPDLVQAHLALGDALRREERFDQALAAYDAGLALVTEPAPWSWPLHFNRAVCLERLGRFEEAVPSFRKALMLNPDQPQVLNYLGYSWIDRGENLEEALTLIQAAVAAAPDTGYIIDSLAWAYYRLGRHAEALAPMERASLLEPVDPIVTDHLGDIYWVNGRQLEARFQWRRALSFGPSEKDAERIRRKLDLGLDAVLREEASQ